MMTDDSSTTVKFCIEEEKAKAVLLLAFFAPAVFHTLLTRPHIALPVPPQYGAILYLSPEILHLLVNNVKPI